MYFVCQRENPSVLTRQDVMFLTSNDFDGDTPNQHVAFCFDTDASYRAVLEMIDSNHDFYNISGSENIISIQTNRYFEKPIIIRGYGAGAEVTAAGIMADINSILEEI